MIWHTHVAIADAIRFAAAVIAVSAFFVGFPGRFGDWWRRTLGAKRALTRSLNLLTPGADREFVLGLLGQPIFASVRGDEETVTFRTKWCWTSVHFVRKSVVAFSVTTTSRKFRWQLWTQTYGQCNAKLGKTRFSELGDSNYGILSYIGAHRTGYREMHYWGNPAGYLYFAFSNNAVGYRRQAAVDVGQVATGNFSNLTTTWASSLPSTTTAATDAKVAAYRAAARVNTLSVLAPDSAHPLGELQMIVEVEQDVVRMFHAPRRLPRLRAWRRTKWLQLRWKTAQRWKAFSSFVRR